MAQTFSALGVCISLIWQRARAPASACCLADATYKLLASVRTPCDCLGYFSSLWTGLFQRTKQTELPCPRFTTKNRISHLAFRSRLLLSMHVRFLTAGMIFRVVSPVQLWTPPGDNNLYAPFDMHNQAHYDFNFAGFKGVRSRSAVCFVFHHVV